MEYKVINIDQITRVVTLQPPALPVRITGLEKLVQIVYLALMNTPGRSATYPNEGSGIVNMIGQYNMSSIDPIEVLSEITIRVEKIKNEILQHQAGLSNLNPSEQLSDFVALKVKEGAAIDQIVVSFRIISSAGETANFVI